MEAHVEMVFGRLDTNGDGVITVEEFIENCQSVSDTIFPISIIWTYEDWFWDWATLHVPKSTLHSGFAYVSFKYENDMPENAYKPKKSNCKQPLVVSSPCPNFLAFLVIFSIFCRLFLPSYLKNRRTQSHSFPSWAVEGSKVSYIKKLTFSELMKP